MKHALARHSLFFVLSFFVIFGAGANDPVARVWKSAAEVWDAMIEGRLTGSNVPITVNGTSGTFAFGGEKEGSSSVITRVMGPKPEGFKSYVASLPEAQRPAFVRAFLSEWASGHIRQKDVRALDGTLKDFDPTPYRNVAALPDAEVMQKFDAWLAQTGDRPFSFIKSAARRKLYNGDFSGQAGSGFHKQRAGLLQTFVPHFGTAEKYLDAAHGTSNGWEINFKAQPDFGEFERMNLWFRTELSHAKNLFEGMGHNWISFPRVQFADQAAERAASLKLAEIYKAGQAWIVLKGLEGNSGVEGARHKTLHNDASLISALPGIGRRWGSGRGVIRVEQRFGSELHSIEQRSGTKSDDTRRLFQQALASRYAAQDFSGLQNADSWTLVSEKNVNADVIAARFRLPKATVEKAFEKIQKTVYGRYSSSWSTNLGERKAQLGMMAPLWDWDDAPFLSETKKSDLRELGRNWLQSVAEAPQLSADGLKDALQNWAMASKLTSDLEYYLKPKTPGETQAIADAMTFRPRTGAMRVDVNAVDLGMEYTSRFGIRNVTDFSDEVLPTGRKAWLDTIYDYTPEERLERLKQVAAAIGREITGGPVEVTRYGGTGDHGHGLEVAWEFRDRQGRKWKVEWDGISRDYDASGALISHSPRGGHIEVVTPKFNPTPDEVAAVYRAFEKESLRPSAEMGGGHINIDLAAFDGKPKEFARFYSTFLEHRGIAALLFQYPGRQRTAEATEVSSRLAQALKSFNGTEEELKQLLYNERQFNTRLGRKARYVQMVLDAYFQDVIPEEFLHADQNIMNDPWRRNFDVDPKIRKIEFRMMDAPASAYEAALQKKFVRAILNKALNDSDALSGIVQKVDHEAYVKNPRKALQDLEKMCTALGLDPQEYRSFLYKGLEQTESFMASMHYQPLSAKLTPYKKMEGWGNARRARSRAQAITSAERPFTGRVTEPEALRFHEARRAARARAEELRAQMGADSEIFRARGDFSSLIHSWSDIPAKDLPVFVAAYQKFGTPQEKSEIQQVLAIVRKSPDWDTALMSSLEIRAKDPVVSQLRELALASASDTPLSALVVAGDPDAAVSARGLEALRRLSSADQGALLSLYFETQMRPQAGPALTLDLGALKMLEQMDLSRTNAEVAEEILESMTPHLLGKVKLMGGDFEKRALAVLERLESPQLVSVIAEALRSSECPESRKLALAQLLERRSGRAALWREAIVAAAESQNDGVRTIGLKLARRFDNAHFLEVARGVLAPITGACTSPLECFRYMATMRFNQLSPAARASFVQGLEGYFGRAPKATAEELRFLAEATGRMPQDVGNALVEKLIREGRTPEGRFMAWASVQLRGKTSNAARDQAHYLGHELRRVGNIVSQASDELLAKFDQGTFTMHPQMAEALLEFRTAQSPERLDDLLKVMIQRLRTGDESLELVAQFVSKRVAEEPKLLARFIELLPRVRSLDSIKAMALATAQMQVSGPKPALLEGWASFVRSAGDLEWSSIEHLQRSRLLSQIDLSDASGTRENFARYMARAPTPEARVAFIEEVLKGRTSEQRTQAVVGFFSDPFRHGPRNMNVEALSWFLMKGAPVAREEELRKKAVAVLLQEPERMARLKGVEAENFSRALNEITDESVREELFRQMSQIKHGDEWLGRFADALQSWAVSTDQFVKWMAAMRDASGPGDPKRLIALTRGFKGFQAQQVLLAIGLDSRQSWSEVRTALQQVALTPPYVESRAYAVKLDEMYRTVFSQARAASAEEKAAFFELLKSEGQRIPSEDARVVIAQRMSRAVDPTHRAAAAEILAGAQGRESRSVLERLSGDASGVVANAARRVLSRPTVLEDAMAGRARGCSWREITSLIRAAGQGAGPR
jgi:hypothetical protein